MHRVMRNVLLAFASLAALSSVASAAPFEIDDGSSAPRGPASQYVQGGVAAGLDDGLSAVGGTVEVGTRVSSFVWLHASFMMGTAHELLASDGSGSVAEGRVGADLKNCTDNGVLCAFAGADVGIVHSEFHSMSLPWGCSYDEGGCMPDSFDGSHTGMIGVGRFGLDIGGKHLRWIPGIEAAVGHGGLNSANVTQSIAYRF